MKPLSNQPGCSLIALIFVLVCSVGAVRQDNVTNSTEISKLANLDQNPLRIGFEPFYQFTNMFIDNTMHFNIPQKLVDMFVNLTQSDRLTQANIEAVINEVKSYYGIHDNVKFITFLPFKISTNFSILFIVCVLFIVAMPIIGLFVCMCRLCLRSKFNPYDRKNDSAKRKLLATIIFCLMVLLLLSTVILFFTNQNANNAMQKSPAVLASSIMKIKGLTTEDTPRYLEDLIINLQNAKSNTSIMVKNFTQKINDHITNNISGDVISVLNETNEIVKSASEIITDMNQESDELNTALARFRAEVIKMGVPELKTAIERVSVDFKVDMGDLNATEVQQAFGEIMKKIGTRLSMTLQALKDKIDTNKIADGVDDKIESIDGFIKILRSNETSETIDRAHVLADYVRFGAHAYEHLYYALMGVSVFMLLWFILYTMGLAGLCARRANETYSQLFHRGVSANLLMTGASFFFIFSSILMVVCVVLFTPGILMRQYIAKPLMFPDSNPALKAAISPALENASLTNFFAECRQKKPILGIREAVQILKEITQVDLANITSGGLIKPYIDEKRQQLQLNLQPVDISSRNVKKVISELTGLVQKLNVDTLLKEAQEIQKNIDNLGSQALDNSKDQDGLRKAWEEFSTRTDNVIRKLESLKDWKQSRSGQISQLSNKTEALLAEYTNQKQFNILFAKMVNKTLDEEILPNFNSVLSDVLMLNESPSCAPLGQVYEDLVTSFCFEFLDNFNTYWFFLLLSIGFHLIVLGFAIRLADLLRKFYAYDEVLTEDIVMDDAKPYDGYSEHHLKEGFNGKSSSYH